MAYHLSSSPSEETILRHKLSEYVKIAENKWSELPPLNTARYFHGAVLLESRKAFCFSGYGIFDDLNGVEAL